MITLVLLVAINVAAWCAIAWFAYRGDSETADRGAPPRETWEPLRR